MKRKIIIGKPHLDDDFTVTIKLNYSFNVRKFFRSNTFFVKYDKDVSRVPESILLIPLLSNIAPIGWAIGAEIILEKIDKVFYEALLRIKPVFERMYPLIKWNGVIIPKYVMNKSLRAGAKDDFSNLKKAGLLFSGGVDSLASYIRHKNENLNLILIFGADIKLDETSTFERVGEELKNFSDTNRSGISFIKSNFREIINEPVLNGVFTNQIDSWWGRIQHGLGLTGLCAPLSVALKISKIYIASSFTSKFLRPWGSNPEIDNNIKWLFTRVEHDGYYLSRQDKIHELANYIKNEDPNLKLRVCHYNPGKYNCNKCEKCLRTIVGLLVEGINPNNHGFKVNSKSFRYVINQFDSGRFIVGDDELFMWEDIRRHAMDKGKINGMPVYFQEWLKNISFDKYKSLSDRRYKWKKIARKIFSYSPLIYSRINYSIIRKIKSILKSFKF